MIPTKYVSVWCTKPHYLVQWLTGPVVVVDGVQPINGLRFPTMREARDWLRDNGFVPV